MHSQKKFDNQDPLPDSTLNWLEKVIPKKIFPYLRLSRVDRPIGTWLLLWPCWWSITLAGSNDQTIEGLKLYFDWNYFFLMGIFAIGSFVMRGAGCTYNDIIDRKYDSKVARTASRPIPSGQISVKKAFLWLSVQSIFGLLILLCLNKFSIILGRLSIVLITMYPFMKRITWWPQFFLGLAFNFGALLGWSAVTNSISLTSILLYLGGIFWTLGYDTIYALQDIHDDTLIGIKSSARIVFQKVKLFLSVMYVMALIFFIAAGYVSKTGWFFWPFIVLCLLHFSWQVKDLNINSSSDCLKKFRSNNHIGIILFFGIILGHLT